MKNLLFMFLVLLTFNLNAQVSFTSTKTFLSTSVEIETPKRFDCVIKNANDQIISVQSTVTSNVNDDQLMRTLNRAGMFKIESKEVDGVQVFTMPKLKNGILFRGQELEFEVEWLVVLPADVKHVESL